MDKVNLKYVPNSSSSSHNNNNNPEDVLKVVKISPLQDFLMKFAPALKRNSVMKTMWRKKKGQSQNKYRLNRTCIFINFYNFKKIKNR